MKLTASPFDANTGDLLPVYRDAYLRGDLSRGNTAEVDAYLRHNRHRADDTLRRFYEMKQAGEQVRPVGWVQRQFELIRTEPQRFRRRAATLVAGAALVTGATMAATNLPTESADLSVVPTTAVAPAKASAMRMVTVRGRILDENGRPLAGATVLDKSSRYGVGTDAEGYYALTLPAGTKTTLQFGYGGYTDDELQVAGGVQNVTLLPREAQQKAKQKRRWLFF
ncbi:carboxypeptidase-like regulatory domain-containing protein [Hymenobacter koreensis]|uniref:Carboxypeptidase-like regulatory domain-containing protein n=1 Tax=Hymenobacter koreensis TaxID=1084523 RepID=A0ABP8IXT9_9BACT